MTRRGPRGLRPDEKELWDKVRESTVPLREPMQAAMMEAIQHIEQPKMPENIAPFVVGGSSLAEPKMRVPRTAVSITMDQKKFTKLKKGKLSPDTKIDLHGMTLSQAHPALIGFILNAHQRSKRLALVVTGKGKPTDDNQLFPSQVGILRQQVPRWLAEYPLAPHVLEVSAAHGKHGGEGALYVYLRRRR